MAIRDKMMLSIADNATNTDAKPVSHAVTIENTESEAPDKPATFKLSFISDNKVIKVMCSST